MFSVHTTPEEVENEQSPAVILDLRLRKTWSGKSHGYRDTSVIEQLRFQNVFCPHENEKPAFSNSSGLKSVFDKLRFRGGLVWRVGLTVVIKLRSNSSGVMWTAPEQFLDLRMTFAQVTLNFSFNRSYFPRDPSKHWSNVGCHKNQSTERYTICHCYHLTSYGLIMDVHGIYVRKTLAPGGWGTRQSFLWGGYASTSNPLPLRTPFWQRRYPFRIPLIKRR